MKRLLVVVASVAALSVALVVPGAGSAHQTAPVKTGIGWELAAGDATEAKLTHSYPRQTWVANCRSTSARTFSCDVTGFGHGKLGSGRATVRKISRYTYRVRIVALNFM